MRSLLLQQPNVSEAPQTEPEQTSFPHALTEGIVYVMQRLSKKQAPVAAVPLPHLPMAAPLKTPL